MKIKPLSKCLLISPLPKVTVTTGGILLVDRYRDDRMQWRVEAVGSGCADIAVGDFALVDVTTHDHLTLDDGRKVIRDYQVIATWGSNDENS